MSTSYLIAVANLMRKKFKKEIHALDDIFTFIQEFFTFEKIDSQYIFPVNLAIEELFINRVKYHPETRNDVLISLERDAEQITASLTDFDVESFDITQAEDVPTDLPIEKREVGGLGIHLIRQMVDHIEYEYSNRNSKITFIKKLR